MGVQKTPAELFDDFIKLEWQDIFRNEVDVRLDNGTRYVPNGGSQGVQLLRKNVNAFDVALRLWSDPSGHPEGSTQGYDRIVEQAGIEYTWEWFLIDPSRPWAGAVPSQVRERIEEDLNRRSENAVTGAKARDEEELHRAKEEDDRVIAMMNDTRREQNKPPLSADQEALVRENLHKNRPAASATDETRVR